MDASVTTKVLLMLAHVIAAAIVVPAIARRLSVGERQANEKSR